MLASQFEELFCLMPLYHVTLYLAECTHFFCCMKLILWKKRFTPMNFKAQQVLRVENKPRLMERDYVECKRLYNEFMYIQLLIGHL